MVHISHLIFQKSPKQNFYNFKDILQYYTLSDGIVAPTSQVCTITVLSESHTALQK